MNIAIITRPDYRSPRILAQSLKLQIEKAGGKAEVFFNIDVLTRLHNYSQSKNKINFHFWLRRKVLNYRRDKKVLAELKKFDAVVISECSPNAFWRHLYDIEKLKKILKRPVLFYEVYFLENAPTQIEALRKSGDALTERYDCHLAVSDVTEIRTKPGANWKCIGLDLSETGLAPKVKKEFIALVDFKQPGYEKYQDEQLQVLKQLGIKTIILNGRYSIEEIRNLYRQASVFFMQFPEAFGLPLSECLASGVQIFTPDSSWPMSWRLDEAPEVHGPGILPECFTVYSNPEELVKRLKDFLESYDLAETPLKIFRTFTNYYPHFYFGNQLAIKEVMQTISVYNNASAIKNIHTEKRS